MSRKTRGMEWATLAASFMGLVGCAHDPMTDPPPKGLSYLQAVECAGLMSALHKLGEPEGWTYDRRADVFAYWAEPLAPGGDFMLVSGAVGESTTRFLARFPGLSLLEDAAELKKKQEELRLAHMDAVYRCEQLSPAFDIVVVAGG
ncbi:MAG: hypothetical protein Q8R82_17675 [Hyphomonadaceae bacterium]|nr:hypothetical protein [Hyphomonadaceae bacterium]